MSIFSNKVHPISVSISISDETDGLTINVFPYILQSEHCFYRFESHVILVPAITPRSVRDDVERSGVAALPVDADIDEDELSL